MCLIAVLLLAGLMPSVAYPCSVGPPQVQKIIPNDGSNISPKAAFTIDYQGVLRDVQLQKVGGDSVQLERVQSYQESVAVYSPVSALSEGDYTLEASVNSSEASKTLTYTVRSDLQKASPEIPKKLTLYTAHLPNIPTSCTSFKHQTTVEFDYPNISETDVGYFVVTYSDEISFSEDDDEGVSNHLLLPDDTTNREVEDTSFLPFEPQCVKVTAYAPDRTVLSHATSCGPVVCASTETVESIPDSSVVVRDWSKYPECGATNPDNDSGSNGSDSRDGSESSSDRGFEGFKNGEDGNDSANQGCGGCTQSEGIPLSDLLLLAVVIVIGASRRLLSRR